MIFELAGIVGVEPWSFSFGQLSVMALARLRSEWDRSSALLAMIHNVNCSRATSMKAPEKFHPFPRHSARRRLSPQESVAAIALAFCVKRKGDK